MDRLIFVHVHMCVSYKLCIYIYVYHILYLSSVQNPGWLILEGFIHVHTTQYTRDFFSVIPSGKRLHNELENHHFLWVNLPFLWKFQ